jgi:membrane protease YdiL (CAAX protease family)
MRKGVIVSLSSFVVGFAGLFFAGGYIQAIYGLTGLIITELFILLCALAFAPLLGQPLRETFKLRAPKRHHISGTLFLFAGLFFLSFAASYVQLIIFPQASEVSDNISSFVSSGSRLLAFIAVAVMPAICEELLCRGTMLAGFERLRRDWVKAVIIGVLFGIFHTNPFRFIGTAILGAGLAYIAVKTQCIFLPMLCHFANNALSTLASFAIESSPETYARSAADFPTYAMAGYAVFGAGLAVAFGYHGIKLLNDVDTGAVRKSLRRSIGAVSAVLIVAGLVLIVAGVSAGILY